MEEAKSWGNFSKTDFFIRFPWVDIEEDNIFYEKNPATPLKELEHEFNVYER